MWISNSPYADIFVVWAKDDADEIRGFVLEKGMKGLTAPKIEGKFSLRTSPTGEIVMADVFVPEDEPAAEREGTEGPVRLPQQGALRHRLGRAGRGGILLARGAPVHARPQGLRQAARAEPADPAEARRHDDRDHARAAGVPARGPLMDEGRATPEMVSLIKRNSCGKALDIARKARDMHGGNGIADEFHVIRHVLNLEAVNTYEGTHDIHALILGRAQTGLSAF
jgi:glutaryl-CoA dehydrogenase